MDPKYRVSIPSVWRPAGAEVLHLLRSSTYDMPMIKVLTNEAFEHRINVIENSDRTPAQKYTAIGILCAKSRQGSLNDQGKLLIPKELSEEVGLAADAELTLVGRGLHFEVWSKENYAKADAIESANHDFDDLGVH